MLERRTIQENCVAARTDKLRGKWEGRKVTRERRGTTGTYLFSYDSSLQFSLIEYGFLPYELSFRLISLNRLSPIPILFCFPIYFLALFCLYWDYTSLCTSRAHLEFI